MTKPKTMVFFVYSLPYFAMMKTKRNSNLSRFEKINHCLDAETGDKAMWTTF